jgi:hypothetical protein
MRYLQPKVLLTVSPFRPSFPPQSDVYPKGPAPSSLATHYSLPTTHFSSPFVFITLRIPFRATPFFSHPYKTPGVWGISTLYLVTRHSFTRSVVCEDPLPLRVISPLVTRHSPLPLVCKPQFRSSLTPFRINTCKSVTKQMTLSTCTINTYAKTGGRGPTAGDGEVNSPQQGREAERGGRSRLRRYKRKMRPSAWDALKRRPYNGRVPV